METCYVYKNITVILKNNNNFFIELAILIIYLVNREISILFIKKKYA